jgi:tyrosyl-tRNA synthetase
VELGGTDQLWNLLMGRDVMREYGLEPQVVLTTPLLVGLDGVEKMSKSLDNAIGVDEAPGQIYGKLMSISDQMMWDYMLLLTDLDETAVAERRKAVEGGSLHPKEVKMQLARRVVAWLHGEEEATGAEAEFEKVFSKGEDPGQAEEFSLPAGETVRVIDSVILAGFAQSKGEARRLVRGGSVYLDGERVTDECQELEGEPGTCRLLRVGRHRFARLRFP